MLNMSFDVPVWILSFHMLLMSLVLLAPQSQRLANVLVLERPSEPASQRCCSPRLGSTGLRPWYNQPSGSRSVASRRQRRRPPGVGVVGAGRSEQLHAAQQGFSLG
jgi:hypothetical protein